MGNNSQDTGVQRSRVHALREVVSRHCSTDLFSLPLSEANRDDAMEVENEEQYSTLLHFHQRRQHVSYKRHNVIKYICCPGSPEKTRSSCNRVNFTMKLYGYFSR